MPIIKYVLRQEGTDSVRAYQRRVYRLAAIYAAIVVIGLASIVFILYWVKLFVTLSQRSNIETLTVAFIVVLFAYLVAVCFTGAWGAVRIVYYNLPTWLGRDAVQVEARKQAAVVLNDDDDDDAVYLNCRVHPQAAPQDSIMIPLRDAAGDLGTIVIDGVKMSHEDGPKHSSNSLFSFFQIRIQQLVRVRHKRAQVEIVQWATINDEPALQYESMVTFSRNLERHLGSGPLWPAVEVTEQDIATLLSEATALCPALRNESYLPDLEYAIEHQLPIIPEPLGLISLSREEQRADPEASMGCALIIMVSLLIILALCIYLPVWVPGK